MKVAVTASMRQILKGEEVIGKKIACDIQIVPCFSNLKVSYRNEYCKTVKMTYKLKTDSSLHQLQMKIRNKEKENQLLRNVP